MKLVETNSERRKRMIYFRWKPVHNLQDDGSGHPVPKTLKAGVRSFSSLDIGLLESVITLGSCGRTKRPIRLRWVTLKGVKIKKAL